MLLVLDSCGHLFWLLKLDDASWDVSQLFVHVHVRVGDLTVRVSKRRKAGNFIR